LRFISGSSLKLKAVSELDEYVLGDCFVFLSEKNQGPDQIHFVYLDFPLSYIYFFNFGKSGFIIFINYTILVNQDLEYFQ